MSTLLSYPGVYIEEIPSGVHTIVGVATSITAFVGRTPCGPVNEATTITSFGDFTNQFGGLTDTYPLTYAVNDFFANGGTQAIIVRLFNAGGAANGGAANFSAGTLNLLASSPGTWGNNLSAKVDTNNITADVASQYSQYGLGVGDLFNLTLMETVNGQVVDTESYYAVSVKSSAGPRRVDVILQDQSELALVLSPLPGSNPAVAAPAPPVAPPGPPAVPPAAAPVPPAAPAVGVDSQSLQLADYVGDGKTTGVYALEQADLFNLLCIPPDQRDPMTGNTMDTAPAVWAQALSYFTAYNKRAVLLIDAPLLWGTPAGKTNLLNNPTTALTPVLETSGPILRNAAIYYPRITEPDPLRNGQLYEFAASGAVAGIIAQTDATRGVWKAPAGIDAGLADAADLEVVLTDRENGLLNPVGINCLRSFPTIGMVVWGARTLRGADILEDDYKYLPIRRLAHYIEESLYRGTKWAVFEPNDEPLWAAIRLSIGSFMQDLFRKGAFQGTSARDAYFVKCDNTTTTANDQDLGIVNAVVGFSPLKPAEFVVLQIQQIQDSSG
jgi:phage tail sheath protein FI